jgi:hypothetical protein
MTTPDESTIGGVEWDRMFAGTDGEQITLIIPAYFQTNHTPYLNDILGTRLSELFGADVPFRLDPGELYVSDTGSRYEAGHIVITGIPEPWPNGTELRAALEEAFSEAGAVESDQKRRADALVAHLRNT